MEQRQGEQNNTHCRAKRFYQINDEWFFATREQLQVGPFASLEEAEMQLNFFLRHAAEGTQAG